MISMNVLTLSVKRKYFDEIVSGTKKTETREIRPNNFGRYCRYIHKGKEYTNIDDIPENNDNIDIAPVNYDAIKFLTGEYKGKRPYAVVEVENSEIVLLQDEAGNDIIYESDGKEYLAAEIEYTLGKITEKST